MTWVRRVELKPLVDILRRSVVRIGLVSDESFTSREANPMLAKHSFAKIGHLCEFLNRRLERVNVNRFV